MKEALPTISLSDSFLKYFISNQGNIIFYLDSWDCKDIEITFSNVIKFKYEIGDFISNIYELSLDENAKKTIQRITEPTSAKEEYKLFHVVDIENFPVFEILAEKITALKKDKPKIKTDNTL